MIKTNIFSIFDGSTGVFFTSFFLKLFIVLMVTDTCSPAESWIFHRYYKVFALGRVLLFSDEVSIFSYFTIKHINIKSIRIYTVFGSRGNCTNHCFFLPTFLGTLQTTGHWPRLGAHLTASVAPQRLAGAPCSPVGDVFSYSLFWLVLKISVCWYFLKIMKNHNKTYVFFVWQENYALCLCFFKYGQTKTIKNHPRVEKTLVICMIFWCKAGVNKSCIF